MESLKLFMVLLGSKPKGRNTEQHDIFFGIGNSLFDLISDMNHFWPEAEGKIHVDSWREINFVDNYRIQISLRNNSLSSTEIYKKEKLFFLNLGGYKPNDLEEYHYKLLVVADDKGKAVQKAKQTAFYQHTGFKAAESHIDDKYGVDVDDIYEIEEVLPEIVKSKFVVTITQDNSGREDELHIGYVKISNL